LEDHTLGALKSESTLKGIKMNGIEDMLLVIFIAIIVFAINDKIKE
jgi:hypothetical protein